MSGAMEDDESKVGRTDDVKFEVGIMNRRPVCRHVLKWHRACPRCALAGRREEVVVVVRVAG